MAAEVLDDHPVDLRGRDARAHSLDDPHRVHPHRVMDRCADQRRHGEQRDPSEKDRASSQNVAGAPGRDQHHAEGQRVARQHPLHVGVRSTEARLDARQGHVDGADRHHGHRQNRQ
ncbi:hypothetical protein SDC9_80268 [bioreactor metagenome]|uniref:Uncharacterized protein n=1 Tax=bioreactor metagenome TaxID=1076179 RepID=A0A644YYL0_9ZZZZ